MASMRKAKRFHVGDRVRLRENHLGLKDGARGTVVNIKNAWRKGNAPKRASRVVFVHFDGVFGTVALAANVLTRTEPTAGPETIDETAESLLREMAELFADRPFQALGKNGPYVCLFCGETTERERRPMHMDDCPWPRVLALVGKAA
jgi:hypothetical protein